MTPVDGSIAIGGGTAVTPEGDTEVHIQGEPIKFAEL